MVSSASSSIAHSLELRPCLVIACGMRCLRAISTFSSSLGAIYQAAELFDRMEKRVLGDPSTKMTLFKADGESDLKRINCLNNVAKHFSASQAERTSTPIWITNLGIKGVGLFGAELRGRPDGVLGAALDRVGFVRTVR